ncbi:MAG: mechanosensitive ion channel family protein [Bacillota bacterium]|jgi:miniconductance mechanosensitive channel|nr:mechanosensitive ion channel [Bacillota bacterium]NLU53842.1 mechanosensitive ion channel [Bacillota bacterium]HOA91407.1 mechanosensitive ion channel [Bacillota bacterium]HOL13446.1 mechanosensitive ion channel [Bacillota bacterium]HPZ73342.1 mechanosensitive ion channel [Bacillota bacterium]
MILEYFYTLLVSSKLVNDVWAGYLSFGIVVLLLTASCVIAYIIAKKVVLGLGKYYIKNNKLKWDDTLVERKVLDRLILYIPAIIVFNAAPIFGEGEFLVQRLAVTYALVATIFVVDAVLNAINDLYNTYAKNSKAKPIKGFIQVLKIVFGIIIFIVLIANLIGQSPVIILSSLGALTAIYSLIFKDAILGFVAGIQLSANDMVRIGDWIEMGKYGADGYVTDITLTTVKVQNWDKTITTIPTYALISDSFKNWRGMFETGGRRIKRSVFIDMTSIRFLTKEDIERLKKIHYLKDYIEAKEKEIEEYNKKHNINPEIKVNGRHLTNIGTFRAYITNYLKNHPQLNPTLLQIVRQLDPGPNGLPLEIYCFTADTRWVVYEGVQSDIFDHILAVASEFDLRIFQNPSGNDLRELAGGAVFRER